MLERPRASTYRTNYSRERHVSPDLARSPRSAVPRSPPMPPVTRRKSARPLVNPFETFPNDLVSLVLSFCTEDSLRASFAACQDFRAASVVFLRKRLTMRARGIDAAGPAAQQHRCVPQAH